MLTKLYRLHSTHINISFWTFWRERPQPSATDALLRSVHARQDSRRLVDISRKLANHDSWHHMTDMHADRTDASACSLVRVLCRLQLQAPSYRSPAATCLVLDTDMGEWREVAGTERARKKSARIGGWCSKRLLDSVEACDHMWRFEYARQERKIALLQVGGGKKQTSRRRQHEQLRSFYFKVAPTTSSWEFVAPPRRSRLEASFVRFATEAEPYYLSKRSEKACEATYGVLFLLFEKLPA